MANTFNISGALEGMNDSRLVHNKSQGECAKSVRSFLERGGLSTTGRPTLAYQYADYLPSIGFSPVATLTGKDDLILFSNLSALIGDIAVMKHGKNGHICMWDGKLWVSDFRLNSMNPYREDVSVTVYRFGNTEPNNFLFEPNNFLFEPNNFLFEPNKLTISPSTKSIRSIFIPTYELLEYKFPKRRIAKQEIATIPETLYSKFFSTYLPVFAKKGRKLIPKKKSR